MTGIHSNKDNDPSIESSWTPGKFWENRQKVRVFKKEDGIHIEVTAQSAWQHLLGSLCTSIHLADERSFCTVKQDDVVEGNLTPNQFRRIREMLVHETSETEKVESQGHAVADTIKEMQRDNIYHKLLDELTEKSQPIEAASPPESPPESPKLTSETGAKQNELLQNPVMKSNPFIPSKETGLSGEEISNTINEVKEYLDHIESLRKPKEIEPNGIFEWIVDYISSAKQFEIHVADEDERDFIQVEESKPDLIALDQKIEALEGSNLTKELREEVNQLRQRAEFSLTRMDCLLSYFIRKENIDQVEAAANTQIVALKQGELNWSLDPAKNLINSINELEKLKATYVDMSPEWKQRMDRKIEFQKAHAVETLENLIDTLTTAIKVEADESTAHMLAAEKYAGYMQGTKPVYNYNYICNHTCFIDTLYATENVLKDLKLLSAYPKYSKEQLIQCRETVTKLVDDMHSLNLPPYIEHNKEINVNAFRAKRPPLTSGKKQALKEQKNLVESLAYQPHWGWKPFFTYLQVWDAASPLTGKLINPIGRRDYDYYVKKMADSAKNKEFDGEYERALTRARSFWGANQDYLDHYDKFLRGEVAYEYKIPTPTPVAQPGSTPSLESNQPADATSLTQTLSDVVQAVFPGTFSTWITNFLGHGEGMAADRTQWESYVVNTIFPAMREESFNRMAEMFDVQLPPPEPSSESTPMQDLYYNFYKMYQCAKDPSLKKEYEAFKAEAQKNTQYSPFAKDWDSYLNARMEAYNKTFTEIPLTTEPLAKVMLKGLVDDATVLNAEIETQEDPNGSTEDFNTLHSHTLHVAGTIAACEDLLQKAPPLYADKPTVNEWLKEVETCRSNYVNAKQHTQAALAHQQFRDQISMAQFEAYMESPPITISDLALAQAFGANFLYGLPFDRVDVFAINDFRLKALRARIDILQNNPLCTDDQTAAFCTAYLNNPVFAQKVRHSDILPYLEKLEAKLSLANQLTNQISQETINDFMTTLKIELSRLKFGDSLFFTENVKGVVYEIINKSDNILTPTYQMRIYSADPRHKFQTVTIDGNQQKILPFKEINKIKQTDLMNSDLWGKLLVNPDDVNASYKHIVQTTGGKPKQKKSNDAELVDAAQNSYYQTLSAFFATELKPYQQAPRFEFETQCKIINDVIKEPQKHNLTILKHAAKGFADNIIKWHADGVITDAETEFAVSLSNRLLDTTANMSNALPQKTKTPIYPLISERNPLHVPPIPAEPIVQVAIRNADGILRPLENNELKDASWKYLNSISAKLAPSEEQTAVNNLLIKFFHTAAIDGGDQLLDPDTRSSYETESSYNDVLNRFTENTNSLLKIINEGKLDYTQAKALVEKLDDLKYYWQPDYSLYYSEQNWEYLPWLKEFDAGKSNNVKLVYDKCRELVIQSDANRIQQQQINLNELNQSLDAFTNLRLDQLKENEFESTSKRLENVTSTITHGAFRNDKKFLREAYELLDQSCKADPLYPKFYHKYYFFEENLDPIMSANYDRMGLLYVLRQNLVENLAKIGDHGPYNQILHSEIKRFLSTPYTTIETATGIETTLEKILRDFQDGISDSCREANNFDYSLAEDLIEFTNKQDIPFSEAYARLIRFTEYLSSTDYISPGLHKFIIHNKPYLPSTTQVVINGWDGNQSSFFDYIQQLMPQIKPAKLNSPQTGLQALQNFIHMVPIDKRKLRELIPTKEDAVKLMNNLHLLTKEYSGLMYDKNMRHIPIKVEDHLGRLKMLAVANMLTNDFDILDRPISLYNSYIDNFLTKANSVQLDATCAKELHDIKGYWQNLDPRIRKMFVDKNKPTSLMTLLDEVIDDIKLVKGFQMKYLIPGPWTQSNSWILNWFFRNRAEFDQELVNAIQEKYKSKGLYFEEILMERELFDEDQSAQYTVTAFNSLGYILGGYENRDFYLIPRFSKNLKTSDKLGSLKAYLQAQEMTLSASLLSKAHPQEVFMSTRPSKEPLTRGRDSIDNKGSTDLTFSSPEIVFKNLLFDNDGARRRVNPNSLREIAATNIHQLEPKELKEQLDIIALSSIRETQIQDTLSFFTRNMALLGQQDYRRLIRFLVFESDILINEFEAKRPVDNEEFVRSLTAFCKEAVTKFEKINDYRAVASLLNFSHQLMQTVNQIRKEYPDLFVPEETVELYNAPEEYRRILQDPKLNKAEKALLYHNLIQTYGDKKSITKDEAIEFSSLLIRSKMYPPPDDWIDDKAADDAIVSSLQQFQNQQLAKIIEGPDRNDILNGIYRQLNPDAQPINWDEGSTYPKFVSEDGRVQIDVYHGIVKESGQSLAYLPDVHLRNKEFISIFGERSELTAIKLDVIKTPNVDSAFQIVGPGGYQYRLIVSPEQTLTIQGKFDGIWHEFKGEPAATLAPAGILHQRMMWQSEGQPPTVILTDIKTGIAQYSVTDSTVYKVDPQGKLTNEVAVALDRATPLGAVVNKLDDPEWTLVFKDSTTNVLTSISLPRLGLDFKIDSIDNQGVAVSTQDSDKFLATHQKMPEIEMLDNFLVLDSKRSPGAFKIIAPRSYKTNEGVIRQQVSVFSWDNTAKRLIPNTQTDTLYLAYLNLPKQDYAACSDYLNRLATQTEAYSNESIDLLQKISEIPAAVSGTHPYANGLKAKAAAMLIKNIEDFSQASAGVISDRNAVEMLDNYSNYLEFKEQRSKEILTEDDERLLIRALQPFIDTVGHPRHHLVITRMEELSVPLTDYTKLMRSFDPSIEQLQMSRKMKFSDIQTQLLDGIHNSDFKRKYELIKKMNDENKCSWSEIRDFAYELGFDKNSYLYPLLPSEGFSWLLPRTALLSLIDRSLRSMKTSNEPNKRLEALLLDAVLHHPEAFPDSLASLSSKDSNDARMDWIAENLINPLRSLVLTDTELQPFLSPLPEKITPPSIYRQHNKPLPPTFDFSSLQPVADSSLPKGIHAVIRESTKTSAKATGLSGLKSTLASTSMKNPLAQREIERIKAQAASYESSGTPRVYELQNKELLIQGRHTLQAKSRDLAAQLDEWKTSIESIVNMESMTPAQRAIQKARTIASSDGPISLDVVVWAYLRNDLSAILAHNPALKPEDFKSIFQSVREYLVLATHKQYIDSIDKAFSEIESLDKQGVSSEELQEKAGEIHQLLAQNRAYDSSEHPEFLVFEYFNQKRFRPEQIKAIESLNIIDGVITKPQNLGKVIEAIPGFGKTSFVMPVLGMMNADGRNIAISVIPKVLMKSMSKELRKSYGTAYDKLVEEMEYSRDSRFDKKGLERILDRLTDVRDNQKLLLIASESIQALFLKMIEKVGEYKSARDRGRDISELGTEVKLFFEIFKRLKESGSVMIDEVDMILDILKSFHYTLGKPEDEYPLPAEATADLFKQLLLNVETRKLLLQTTTDGTEKSFTEENYNTSIKPALINTILQGNVGNEQFKTFISTLSNSNKDLVRQFLNGQISQKVISFTNQIPGDDFQDTLAVYKEQINEILPIMLPRQLKGHYGPSLDYQKGGEHLLAVPWNLGRVSPKGTQFGSDLMIITNTLMMYTKGKFTPEVMKILIKSLEEKIKAKRGEGQGLEDIPEYTFFTQVLNPDNQRNIMALTEEDYGEITALVNEDYDKILEVVSKLILPEMKIYLRDLSADAQLFGLLFNKIQGFSGTLWNADTYVKMITEIMKSETDAKTLAMVWNNDPVRIVPSIGSGDDATIKETVKKLVTTPENKSTSIIDAANNFAGIPNEDVAKSLYKQAKENKWDVQYVGYYDANDQLKVITQEDGKWKSLDLDPTTIPKDQMVFYWDQSHTTGSNVVLSPTMQAGLSIGRHTILRDFIQAAWRLRGLEKSQKIHLAMTNEDREIIAGEIKKQTGRDIAGDLTMADIMIYLVAKQADRQGQDNYSSFKQKINAVLLDKAIKGMINSPNLDTMLEVYGVVKDLFLGISERRPYKQYAQPAGELSKESAVKADIDQLLTGKIFQKIKAHPFLKQFAKDIESEVKALGKSEINQLPDMIKRSTAHSKDRQVQAQADAQKTAEAQKQQQMQMNVNVNVMSLQTDVTQASSIHDQGAFVAIPESTWPVPKGVINAEYFKTHAKLFNSVNTVLKDTLSYPESPLFSANLTCTSNLCPYHYTASTFKPNLFGAPTYEPFDNHQKEFTQLLITKDKKTGQMNVLMIDQNEEKQWKQMISNNNVNIDKKRQEEAAKMALQKCKENGLENRFNSDPEFAQAQLKQAATEFDALEKSSGFQIVLYDMNRGIYAQGSEIDRMSNAELESSQAFQTMKVQAKFFDGETHYSKFEMDLLESWITSKDPLAMRSLFIDKILPWKTLGETVDMKKFNQTPIGRLFQSLKAKQTQSFFSTFWSKLS